MTKILFMIACLRAGGSEAYLLNLVKNIDQKRFQVTVWCEGEWGPAGDDLIKAGATVFQRRLSARPGDIIKAVRYIRRERFDIVHSLKYGPSYIDPLVTKMARVKVFVGSRRNLPHWVTSMRITNPDRIRNSMTDHIIANSKTVKDITVRVEKFSEDEVSVIYNGVDLVSVDAITQESGQNYRKTLEIPPTAFVIGNVADLREPKGQSFLLRAFADVVRRTEEDVYLIIQGQGPLESSLRSLAKELGIEGRVKIDTTRQNRLEVIRSFQVFVLPSLTERFPNPLVDTMAMSLPCIATDVGAIPEVVVNGVTGLIVPAKSVEQMAEAILKVIGDPSMAKDFGARGREFVERQFTVRQMGLEHERVYDELLKKR